MHVVVYEDREVSRLGVVVAARPVCDLTIGTATLRGRLAEIGPVHCAVRPYLARHLAACVARGLTLWGSPATARSPAAAAHAVSEAPAVLVVNARVVPAPRHMALLHELANRGQRCVVRVDGALAAAVLHPGVRADDHRAIESLLASDGPDIDPMLALELPEAAGTVTLLGDPHHLMTAHEATLEDALAVRIDGGGHVTMRPGLHVAVGAQVDDLVAVRSGPVVVEAGARIGPFVCIDGPVWIGADARINPHAWIRAGTAIGRAARVGGEIEATVLEPYANKPHEGFLGHAHIGAWVNLAAGTITGNLKSTYGDIRLHEPRSDGTRATVHTGRQFLGAFVGELVRTAIGTLLPCGARVGVAATIGGTVPDRVAPFHNMLVGGAGGSRSTVDQVATILERMMARRGVRPLPVDRELLAAVAAAERGDRTGVDRAGVEGPGSETS